MTKSRVNSQTGSVIGDSCQSARACNSSATEGTSDDRLIAPMDPTGSPTGTVADAHSPFYITQATR